MNSVELIVANVPYLLLACWQYHPSLLQKIYIYPCCMFKVVILRDNISHLLSLRFDAITLHT